MKHVLLLILFLLTGYCEMSGQKCLSGSTYTYREMGGICITTFRFIDDSLFQCKTGCEQYVRTYYGLYRTQQDTLFLEHGIRNSYVRILTIDTSSQVTSQGITLKFLDEKGRNISKYFYAYLFKEPDSRYSLSYDTAQQALVTTNQPVRHMGISTLKALGVSDLPEADFSQPISITYHLWIPEFIYPLLNKNIRFIGHGVLLSHDDELIPLNDIHKNVFADEPVIYKKNKTIRGL